VRLYDDQVARVDVRLVQERGEDDRVGTAFAILVVGEVPVRLVADVECLRCLLTDISENRVRNHTGIELLELYLCEFENVAFREVGDFCKASTFAALAKPGVEHEGVVAIAAE